MINATTERHLRGQRSFVGRLQVRNVPRHEGYLRNALKHVIVVWLVLGDVCAERGRAKKLNAGISLLSSMKVPRLALSSQSIVSSDYLFFRRIVLNVCMSPLLGCLRAPV